MQLVGADWQVTALMSLATYSRQYGLCYVSHSSSASFLCLLGHFLCVVCVTIASFPLQFYLNNIAAGSFIISHYSIHSLTTSVAIAPPEAFRNCAGRKDQYDH